MDQWQRFEQMTSDKLMDEIQSLNKRLFKLTPNTSMYNQLLDMINLAGQVYHDKLYVHQLSGADTSKVIDIGEIERGAGQPNYGTNLLDVVVDSYVSSVKDTKK